MKIHQMSWLALWLPVLIACPSVDQTEPSTDTLQVPLESSLPERPPSSFVVDENLPIHDEDGNSVSLEEFEERLFEGGWMPKPQTDENGRVVELLLVRSDGNTFIDQGRVSVEAFAGSLRRWKDEPLPDLDFQTLEGRRLSAADLKGRIVVLNFWFSGCKPCLMEIPELNEMVEEFSESDVIFVALTTDNEAKAREVLGKHRFAYQIVVDSRPVHELMGISSYPTHLIFDRSGRCVAGYAGYSPGVGRALAASVRDLADPHEGP